MTHKTKVEKVVLDDGTPAYRCSYQLDKEEIEVFKGMSDEQKEQFARTISDEINLKFWKTVDDEVFKRLMYGDTEI